MKTSWLILTLAPLGGLVFFRYQRPACAPPLTPHCVAHLRAHYSREALRYFSQVAFGNDLGTLSPTIRRWHRSQVNVRILSACDSAKRHEVARILHDLNAITRSTHFVVDLHAPPNLKIYLVPSLPSWRFCPTPEKRVYNESYG